ncbi:MAG: UDP-2,3-diacylglucosamine diphosphatase LpxI [Nitrospirae bacterium]|nr:UDP-2,3-diacylglucosamine diphosphatase LpxI [Nitrospirota bacterium]
MKTLGLLAASGELPYIVAYQAKKMGYTVNAIGLDPLVNESLRKYVDHLEIIHVGKMGTIIKTLLNSGAEKTVMAGKVPKIMLSNSQIKPDLKAASMLLKLKNKSDDEILLTIINEFERQGINIINITDIISSLLTPKGVLGKHKLDKHMQKDIDFGLPIARAIGSLDIGQTIIISDRAVMAVEAIEGTDQAIIRGCSLCNNGSNGNAVVIKVLKPQQDMRYDVPTAGVDTINTMIKAGAKVLALEAGRTLMINKEEMIALADKAGITIAGVA